ncbi:hypothetical protein HK104_007977 [Borealophlyctis nickersoniae]|nr:hypothetical protein HK104_007977 [Borealophlyctis nickersoniae]
MYPVVCLQEATQAVTVNLGGEEFLFDVEGFVQNSETQRRNEVEKVCVSQDDVKKVVEGYLLWNGYRETYESLVASGGERGSVGDAAGCERDGTRSPLLRTLRIQITHRIHQGDVTAAHALTLSHYPTVLATNPSLCTRFGCQAVVEMIRRGVDGEECVQRLRRCMGGVEDEESEELVEAVCTLLAYPHPHTSPPSYLLDPAFRDTLSDHVNRGIISLATGTPETTSNLGTLIRQCVCVQRELRCAWEGGGGGEYGFADVVGGV